MMGRTHALAGIAALWLLQPTGTITQDTLIPLLVFAVFGALLPDLDAADSQIKYLSVAGITPFAPLSRSLHQTFGHRGLLHSAAGLLVAAIACAVPLGLWLGWPAAMALSLGYTSHLFTDAMTKSGIPLLYPRRRRYHVLPKGWRITTGSMAEEAIFPALAFAVLLLLFAHLTSTS